MDRNTRRALWVVAGVVVFIALVLHHNITSDEIIFFVVVVPSIILHEVSHGYVAHLFGDDTAKRAGRLTLNPAKHVDPVGTLIVPALLALGGFGGFGWAKPVPVNPARLRSPRNQGLLVSLAGPATNFVLAVISALVFVAVFRTTFNASFNPSVLSRAVLFFSVVNIGLMVFNLIPLPPLDGSVLFERLLPARFWPRYLRIRPYTMLIIVGLVVINFYIGRNGNGPLTCALFHLYNWWLGVVGVTIRFG
jgi:Zn-dependent protease